MKKYIALFVFSLLVFTAIKAPASLLQKKVPNFILSGKIINGYTFDKKVGKITWKFNPLKILAGVLAFDITVLETDNKIKSTIGINIFGEVVLSDSSGDIDTKYLQKFIPKIPNMATAKIKILSANATTVDFKKFIPNYLQANLEVNNINILGEKIGNYLITTSIKDDKKFATITNNKKSSFNLNAKAVLLNKNIKLSGKIIGKNQNSKNLLNTFGIKEKLNYNFNLK